MKVKVSYSATLSEPTLSESQELDLSLAIKKGGEWTIGRSPDSDLILDSPDVSRLHGKFFFKGGNYYFCDFGSRNGSIVNGKLAVANQAYILRDGDIIRIGDFILTMEEIISLSQQAETVVRIINPSVFSNRRSTKNADNASVNNNQTPESVSIPEEVSNADFRTPVAKEGEQPVNVASQEVKEGQQPGNAASVQVDEVPSEEVTLIQSEDIKQGEEITTIESTMQPSVADSVAPEIISNEVTEIATQVDEEVRADVGTEVVSGAIPEIEERPDFTYVQPRNIIEQFPDEITTPQRITQPTETVKAPEVVSFVALEESEDLETAEAKIDVSTQSEELKEDAVSESVSEAPELSTQTIEDAVSESVSEATELSTQTKQDAVSESVSQAPELSTQTIEKVPETESAQSDEISETNTSEYPENISQKRIILIAHESKKSELADFVTAHQKFFSLCHTITWASVSELLHKQVGITISEQIPVGTSGGYQTIASLVGSKDISAVIFLRDFLQPQPGQANEDAMLRLCNINQILLATNVTTAEAIVHYITHAR